MTDGEDSLQWHLDKKIPITIIITLILQLVGFGWIASKLDSRIESLEKADVRHERSLDAQNIASDDAKARIIRIEEGMRHTLEALARIEENVSRSSARK